MLGLFTHEIHNIMLSTSIGSFLFGVVMMLTKYCTGTEE